MQIPASPSTSDAAPGQPARQSLLYLDPRELEPDEDNVRQDMGDLEALAESLRRYGVLQPLGVTRPNGRYRVVYGNRRREAAILAGLPAVPCVPVTLRGTTDHLVAQLLENMQRRDLNDMEKAEGLARLRRHYAHELGQGAKAETLDARVAEAVGLAPRTVRRYLSLRELAPGVRDLLAEGRLTVTQARHLGQVGTPALQEQVAARAAEEDWTAAQMSRVCAAMARTPGLSVEQAVETAGDGWTAVERLGPSRRADAEPEAPQRVPRGGRSAAEPAEDDSDLWAEDATGAPTPEALGEADLFGNDPVARKNETADGHRVFRIRTLAAFCDEVDRIARCVQEGDLGRSLKSDPAWPARLGLAAKQLSFTLKAVDRLLA